jgi:hypothetical protein
LLAVQDERPIKRDIRKYVLRSTRVEMSRSKTAEVGTRYALKEEE